MRGFSLLSDFKQVSLIRRPVFFSETGYIANLIPIVIFTGLKPAIETEG